MVERETVPPLGLGSCDEVCIDCIVQLAFISCISMHSIGSEAPSLSVLIYAAFLRAVVVVVGRVSLRKFK